MKNDFGGPKEITENDRLKKSNGWIPKRKLDFLLGNKEKNVYWNEKMRDFQNLTKFFKGYKNSNIRRLKHANRFQNKIIYRNSAELKFLYQLQPLS